MEFLVIAPVVVLTMVKKNGMFKKCPACNKEFYVKMSHLYKRKYCSMKCRKNGMTKNCLICGKEFYIKRVLLLSKKYCSKKCFGIAMKGKPAWNKGLGHSSKKDYCPPKTTKNGKTITMSHIIWCSHSGNPSKVPKGFVINHIDGNYKNNNYNNLSLMNKIEHHKLHHKLFKLRRKQNGD